MMQPGNIELAELEQWLTAERLERVLLLDALNFIGTVSHGECFCSEVAEANARARGRRRVPEELIDECPVCRTLGWLRDHGLHRRLGS